jgi:hypothetical protein
MSQNKVEDGVDAEMYEEERQALTQILDALQPLTRERRRKIMECAKNFFELPRE